MRRFLNPKAAALAVVAVVLMAVMVMLGLWQLGVYDDQQRANARATLQQQPTPLNALMGPDAAFPGNGEGRPITVTGRYLPTQQVYVRNLAGSAERYAVVTPLVTANGSAIMVVRGSSPQPRAAAPAGVVRVDGILEASGETGGRPNAQRIAQRLSIPGLVSSVKPDLYSGYVLLRASTPRQSPALATVNPPLPTPSRWAGLRNLLYACQWWVFAGFVAFMWWRMTEDAAKPRRPDTEALSTLR